MRFQHESLRGLKEADDVGSQCVLKLFGTHESSETGKAVFTSRVERFQVNRLTLARGDFACGLNVDRDVYRY